METKCEPMDIVLTSNPPQSRCKNCGQTWYCHKEPPVCKETKDIEKEEENKIHIHKDDETECLKCKFLGNKHYNKFVFSSIIDIIPGGKSFKCKACGESWVQEKKEKDWREEFEKYFVPNHKVITEMKDWFRELEGTTANYYTIIDFISQNFIYKPELKKFLEGEIRQYKKPNFPAGNGLDYADARLKYVTEFDKTTGHNSALKLVEDYIDKE